MILLAEDEPAARRLLAVTLERMGFEVREAANGEEALRLALAERPDLLVLDIQMPILTGAEVCRHLRASEESELQTLPVIMLTAHSGEAAEIGSLQAGANDFVTKPVSRDVLAARIQTQLRLRSMANELRERNEELARWRTEHEADLAAAHTTQQVLIPVIPPGVPGWNIQTLYQPLIEVGGDVFGWQAAGPGRWIFWLADATGHGAAAALFTALVAQLFRQACEAEDRPAAILGAVNRHFQHLFRGRAIITACCATLDDAGNLRFAGGGHPPLLLRRADGTIETFGPHGTVLGLKEDEAYTESRISLNDDDLAVLYSDGLHAFRKPDGERFTCATLGAVLAKATHGERFFDRLLEALRGRSDGQSAEDDIAAIALRKLGSNNRLLRKA